MKVILGPVIGEKAKDGKIENRHFLVWCGMHNIRMLDAKDIKKTEMQRKEVTEKDGSIKYVYICPIRSCMQTVREEDLNEAYKKTIN